MAEKCCMNRWVWNSLTGTPPTIFDPPSERWYFYQIAIQGNDNTTDLYNGALIDGVEYNTSPGTMDAVDVWFLSDMNAAGINSDTENAFNAFGSLITNADTSALTYYFWFLSRSTHSVTVHLNINSVDYDVVLDGGVVVPYTKSASNVAIFDPAQVWVSYSWVSPVHGGGTVNLKDNSFGSWGNFDTSFPASPTYRIDFGNIFGSTGTITALGGGQYDVRAGNILIDMYELEINGSAAIPLT